MWVKSDEILPSHGRNSGHFSAGRQLAEEPDFQQRADDTRNLMLKEKR